MNRYSLNQTQLCCLLLFAGTIPVLALVFGFHLAWQYHDGKAAFSYSVVQADEHLRMPIENATPSLVVDSDAAGLLASVEQSEIAGLESVAVASEPQYLFDSHTQNTEVNEREIEQQDSLIPESQGEAINVLDTTPAFALQLGAFRDKHRAIAWASKKRLEHQNVHLLMREVKGQVLYTVAVGHYEKREEAKIAQKSLVSKSGVSSYVIEYRQKAKEIVLST